MSLTRQKKLCDGEMIHLLEGNKNTYKARRFVKKNYEKSDAILL